MCQGVITRTSRGGRRSRARVLQALTGLRTCTVLVRRALVQARSADGRYNHLLYFVSTEVLVLVLYVLYLRRIGFDRRNAEPAPHYSTVMVSFLFLAFSRRRAKARRMSWPANATAQARDGNKICELRARTLVGRERGSSSKFDSLTLLLLCLYTSFCAGS